MFPLPLLRVNRKQANQSAIQANWSAIGANRNVIQANRSVTEANRSASLQSTFVAHQVQETRVQQIGISLF